ncbi:MAG: sulfatase-like hydrolase/transferase [Pirellulales bacterium]|nr:sulfatase-like hydrolase/transferase [Pirellulales bacterium]
MPFSAFPPDAETVFFIFMRDIKKILLFVLVATVVVLAVYKGRFFMRSHPNVLLISIDTCRPDHLSCYGHSSLTTPNIDELARDGTLFETVISPIPTTLPSHCSMMTGTIPPYHGVHSNLVCQLRDSNVTLAELLQQQGYTTGATIGAFVLNRQFGIAQGFQSYDDIQEGARKAKDVNRSAFKWLEEHRKEPFFLFLHYYDPHLSYDPPEPFASQFDGAPYDGEIAYVDHCIGQIINRLKKLGLYDSTLIIITSDHGEGLGEHGEDGHGYFVYHSTTKVPLIIKWPNSKKPLRVMEKVGLTDIAPTILSTVGLECSEDMLGLDLSTYVSSQGEHPPERGFYSESFEATAYGCAPLLSMESSEWKYIHCPKPELYNVEDDPKELTNVEGTQPAKSRLLKDSLQSLLNERVRLQDQVSLDSESVAKLESLGYVGGRVKESFDLDSDAEDPKDFHRVYNLIDKANVCLKTRDYSRAQSLCGQILAERNDIGKAYSMLGIIASKRNRLDLAEVHYKKASELDPTSPEPYEALGNLYSQQKLHEKALANYRKAIQLSEKSSGDNGSNTKAFSPRAQINPIKIMVQYRLADTLFHLKRFDEAAIEIKRVLDNGILAKTQKEFTEKFADLYYKLGISLLRTDKPKEAAEVLNEVLKFKPNHPAARKALAEANAQK